MQRYLYFLSLLGFFNPLAAQFSDLPPAATPLRLEFPLANESVREPVVIPLGERGLLYLTRSQEPVDRFAYRWQFVHCDTNLREKWRGEYLLTADQDIKAYHPDGHLLYLLFGKLNSFDHIMYQINLEDGSVVVDNIYALLKVNFDDIFVANDDVLLQGQLNGRPVVLHYDLNSRRSRVLSSIYALNTEIDDIYVDPFTAQLHVTMVAYRRRKSRLIENIYAPGGDLISSREVPSPRDRNLLAARLATPAPGRQLMVGTYSDQSLYYPQGTFTVNRQAEAGGGEATEMNDFTALDNFFNHLKPTRQQRIKRRIFRRQEKGKDFRVRYRFLVHDLLPVGDHYLFVAESYYPQYRSEAMRGGYMQPGYGTYRVFDGYRYTHVFLCLLDQKGHMVWDNSVTMPTVTSYTLEELATVQAAGDTVTVLLRDQASEVTVNRLVRGEVIETSLALSLPHAFERDETLKSSHLQVEAWYGDRLLVWGEQKLLNKTMPAGAISREVFFIARGVLAPLPVHTQGR